MPEQEENDELKSKIESHQSESIYCKKHNMQLIVDNKLHYIIIVTKNFSKGKI